MRGRERSFNCNVMKVLRLLSIVVVHLFCRFHGWSLSHVFSIALSSISTNKKKISTYAVWHAMTVEILHQPAPVNSLQQID